MIVPFHCVDKSDRSTGVFALRDFFCRPNDGLARHIDVSFDVGGRRPAMRARTGLCLFGAFFLAATAGHAVDRGQFADVPEDIRAWFKGVHSPNGVPCCDIADGHRTVYDVRAGSYWVPIDGVWWRVPERAIVRGAGNPLGEAVVWYVSVRGNIEIRCFVPADAS
jgi:hypothetical protein